MNTKTYTFSVFYFLSLLESHSSLNGTQAARISQVFTVFQEELGHL